MLAGTAFHSLIDNTSALAALIGGYSSKLDSSLFIGLAHETLVSHAMRPWFGHVRSEDNWSDEPSRGEYASLEAAGATFRLCRAVSRSQFRSRLLL